MQVWGLLLVLILCDMRAHPNPLAPSCWVRGSLLCALLTPSQSIPRVQHAGPGLRQCLKDAASKSQHGTKVEDIFRPTISTPQMI